METESKLTRREQTTCLLTVLLFICMGLFTFQKLFLFAFHVVVGILDKGKFFKMKNKMKTTSHPVIHTR